ncbi:ABC transporter ATP-binding protein [soil metagenome]
MTLGVETRDLTVRFGDTVAVDALSVTIPAGTLCGLLGRNGSGKTTLLETIAAFRRASGGQVQVGGGDPYENQAVVSDICLIRETGDVEADSSIKNAFEVASLMRPHWDQEYAEYLLERFELHHRRKVKTLSLGQRSTLGTILGLATRAPLTMFDESYLGMDAVSRRVFYDELLSDYLRTSRTVIISTHLIGEIAPLLEQVVMIDHGRLTLHEDVETLRARGTSLTGRADVIDRLVVGSTVLDDRRLGPTKQVTVYGELDPSTRAAAIAEGVEFGAVSLSDLLVYLTDVGRRVEVEDPDGTHEVATGPQPSIPKEEIS